MESIIRAKTVKRGRVRHRQALVKWTGWVEPTWEPIENIKETTALRIFENKYGSIHNHNGPAEDTAGLFFGPPEPDTMEKRRSRRLKNKKN